MPLVAASTCSSVVASTVPAAHPPPSPLLHTCCALRPPAAAVPAAHPRPVSCATQNSNASIKHSGDEREGDEDLGDGDDEIIIVELARLPPKVPAATSRWRWAAVVGGR